MSSSTNLSASFPLYRKRIQSAIDYLVELDNPLELWLTFDLGSPLTDIFEFTGKEITDGCLGLGPLTRSTGVEINDDHLIVTQPITGKVTKIPFENIYNLCVSGKHAIPGFYNDSELTPKRISTYFPFFEPVKK